MSSSAESTSVSTTRFAPTATVIATPLHDGGMVLLHLATQTYYTLNATGSHIWQGISDGLLLTEIEARLVQQYKVTMADATHAVAQILQDLLAESLVCCPAALDQE